MKRKSNQEVIEVSKRSVLKSMGGIAIPFTANSVDLSGARDRSEGDVVYSRVDITFEDTPNAPEMDTDSISDIRINPNKNAIASQKVPKKRGVTAEKREGLSKRLKSEKCLVRSNGFNSPPFTAYEGHSSQWLPVGDNKKVKAKESVNFPEVAVKEPKNMSTIVEVNGQRIQVKPTEAARVKLSNTEIKFDVFGELQEVHDNRTGEKRKVRKMNETVNKEVTPVVNIKNFGALKPVSNSQIGGK